MLQYVIAFLGVAIIAAVLGASGLVATAAGITKSSVVVFLLFAVLFHLYLH